MISCIIQARNGSNRLSGKVLKTLPETSNTTVLEHVVRRVQAVKSVDNIIIATTDREIDYSIMELAHKLGVKAYAGSENNVLERFYLALDIKPEHVIRITGDCPCLDSETLSSVINTHLTNGNDYTTNALIRSFPHGLDVEIFKYEVLEEAYQNASQQFEKEHVTPYIYKSNAAKFKIENVTCSYGNYQDLRITLDTKEDYALLDILFLKLGNTFSLQDIIAFAKSNHYVFKINQEVIQKKVFKNKQEEILAAIDLLKTQDMPHAAKILESLHES